MSVPDQRLLFSITPSSLERLIDYDVSTFFIRHYFGGWPPVSNDFRLIVTNP